MTTLIIPCAGKSSRFPNMKPKWLLTHPDGRLMIDKSLDGIDVNLFDRVVVTIVRDHVQKYEADVIIKQIFGHDKKYEICILDGFTASPAETIFKTIQEKQIAGQFVVKDSDNYVKYSAPEDLNKNFLVTYNLSRHPEVPNVAAKSFVKTNGQNIILDIVEKQIVSSNICLGVYGFESTNLFCSAYEEILENGFSGELFLSRVVGYLINSKDMIFSSIEAEKFEDWGTLGEWKNVQQKHSTLFVDVDGVLLRNFGLYGRHNWDNTLETIDENLQKVAQMQKAGAQIVITTSRPERFRKQIQELMLKYNIIPHAIVMGLNHAPRIIINDFAATNPYPSCRAISIKRNDLLKEYF